MIIYCLKCGRLIAGRMALDNIPEIMRCNWCKQEHEVLVKKTEVKTDGSSHSV